ncbi:hypothetical protein ACLESO_39640 [Pyxidicoccus sp. 3LG]
MSALEATLRLLTAQLHRVRPSGSHALTPLQEAARLAVPHAFEVPESHRGALKGRMVTATKRAFIEGLQPFHEESLRPQAEFNAAVVRVLEYLSVHRTLGLRDDASGWVREQLESKVDPTRWKSGRSLGSGAVGARESEAVGSRVSEVPVSAGRARGSGAPGSAMRTSGHEVPGSAERSRAGGILGSLMDAAKRSYLTAMGPVLEGLLRGQATWNAAMVEALVAASAPRPPSEVESAKWVAGLVERNDPLRPDALPRALPGRLAPCGRSCCAGRRASTSSRCWRWPACWARARRRPRPPELGDYEAWCARHEPADISAAREAVARLETKPLVSLVTAVHDTPESFLRECLASVQAQVYPEWECCSSTTAARPRTWPPCCARPQRGTHASAC